MHDEHCCTGTCNQGRTCPARRRQTLDRLAAQLGRVWLFACALIVIVLTLMATTGCDVRDKTERAQKPMGCKAQPELCMAVL